MRQLTGPADRLRRSPAFLWAVPSESVSPLPRISPRLPDCLNLGDSYGAVLRLGAAPDVLGTAEQIASLGMQLAVLGLSTSCGAPSGAALLSGNGYHRSVRLLVIYKFTAEEGS